MLTDWSRKYAEALLRSDKAKDPVVAKFKRESQRTSFLTVLRGRSLAGLRIVPLEDGLGVQITRAGVENLLEVVRLAKQGGGRVLFPGALP